MTVVATIATAVGLCLPGVSPLIDVTLGAKELRVDFDEAVKLGKEKSLQKFSNQIKDLKECNIGVLVFNTIALISTVASLYFLGFLGTTLGSIAIGFHCLPLVGRAYWWHAINNLEKKFFIFPRQ